MNNAANRVTGTENLSNLDRDRSAGKSFPAQWIDDADAGNFLHVSKAMCIIEVVEVRLR